MFCSGSTPSIWERVCFVFVTVVGGCGWVCGWVGVAETKPNPTHRVSDASHGIQRGDGARTGPGHVLREALLHEEHEEPCCVS